MSCARPSPWQAEAGRVGARAGVDDRAERRELERERQALPTAGLGLDQAEQALRAQERRFEEEAALALGCLTDHGSRRLSRRGTGTGSRGSGASGSG